MLNTPIGVRRLEGSERRLFLIAAKSLANRLSKQIEEESGLLPGCKPFMSGTGRFHTITPLEQLCLLHTTCHQLTETHWKFNNNILTNSSIECVYSWIAHQIAEELAQDAGAFYRRLTWDALSELPAAVPCRFYYRMKKAEEWVDAVDVLAAKTVWEDHLLKELGFPYGMIPGTVMDAQEYFSFLEV